MLLICVGFYNNALENLKKSRPQKLVKSNKSISRIIFFVQIPFFAISKMAKMANFLAGEKSLLLTTAKIFDLFDFMSFLPGLF